MSYSGIPHKNKSDLITYTYGDIVVSMKKLDNFYCEYSRSENRKLKVTQLIHESLIKYDCLPTKIASDKMLDYLNSKIFDYHDFYQFISNHNDDFVDRKIGRSYLNRFTSRIKGELRRHKNELK